MSSLDGPRIDAASGQARQLVVLLHGDGADGNDLIALGQPVRQVLPNAAFVSPHAPEPCGMGFGRQWFALTFRDPGERWRGVQAAAPVLDAFLDAELERLGLPSRALALIGFSQGAMMAMHVGVRRPEAPAAILSYSGALAGPEHVAAQAVSRPPMLLVHGDRDEVIPVEALHQAREHLGAAGLAVAWHVSAGLGHGIDPEGLKLGAQFLHSAFAETEPGTRAQ